MSHRASWFTAVVVVLAFAACAAAQAPQPPQPLTKPLDVPYVPTDEKLVDAMLKVANVKKTDVLYDLGSGDGRIVITAAKKFGTRGVGIDLDPVRIAEANENAKKAGVTHLVKFIHGDIFEQDFKEATVVTMYLLPDVNMKLRPKILDMKPGTRIVSHNYDMGDWKPLQTLNIPISDTPHQIYYWVVPAKKP
ncbi:MAG TPA: methyltransferase domain-containing protein [Terriglobales bacterium]|nr:methyltransferase domain-containing protein [Terriglobales bacterium]